MFRDKVKQLNVIYFSPMDSVQSIKCKTSELIAMSTFTANGMSVAIPFGNQRGFDFLFEEDRIWKRAQVKTAARSTNGHATINATRTIGRTRKALPYTLADTDYIIAVCLETSTVWKLSLQDTENKQKVSLGSEFIFSQGTGIWSRINQKMPKLDNFAIEDLRPIHYLRAKLLDAGIPDRTQRPVQISESTWDLLSKYSAGYSYSALAGASGTGIQNVQRRLWNASKWLFPEDQRIMGRVENRRRLTRDYARLKSRNKATGPI